MIWLKIVRMVLDEYISNFITNELPPGIYIFKDLSEVPLRILQSEYEVFKKSIDIEFDDITVKTKLAVRLGIIAIRFDKKSF